MVQRDIDPEFSVRGVELGMPTREQMNRNVK